ncbi:hypothetical protein ACFVFS_16100 [Kitasatospora sp. NPDC057692]|uniref:hypothetical protein n=1 Tax=Kitasatospora sp. NPDC057692 TaxID=3346215 RepID=UPI00367415E3
MPVVGVFSVVPGAARTAFVTFMTRVPGVVPVPLVVAVAVVLVARVLLVVVLGGVRHVVLHVFAAFSVLPCSSMTIYPPGVSAKHRSARPLPTPAAPCSDGSHG